MVKVPRGTNGQSRLKRDPKGALAKRVVDSRHVYLPFFWINTGALFMVKRYGFQHHHPSLIPFFLPRILSSQHAKAEAEQQSIQLRIHPFP